MLTLRWYALALVIPALLILAAFAPVATLLAPIYAFGLLLMTWLDRRSAGSPDQFTLQRQHDQKLSLGVPNPIMLDIHSRAGRGLAVIVRDEPPPGMTITHKNAALVSPGEPGGQLMAVPRETQSVTYYLRPVKRGDYRFGDLNLRWAGPLGLYVRQTVYQAAAPVKVYPNIYEIRRYELLVQRDQLTEMGLKNVRLRGEGTDFESLRDYTPDDPYRSINWKATARRAKPISTNYEPERSQRVVILLDVGRMMRGVIRVDDPLGDPWNMAKVDFVINSILLLSYVASRKGDQVGLLVFADQVLQYIPPAPGNAQFHKLLEAMYALGSEPVEADYGRAITYLRTKQKKRSLVILFTDLSGAHASEKLMSHLPRLAPQHVPLLVTIRDPILDTEAALVPDHSDALYRRAVAEQLINERRLLLENLQRHGVATLDVDASHLSVNVVNRYLQLKRRSVI
ncbi:MAG: DUF58 domain-containing protein [Anaerolineaceae bacterium]|nr:DUF58 domain-containing protein [Anaerolineaceae bacterium]